MEVQANRVGPGLPAVIRLSIPSGYISGAELSRQLHRTSDGVQHYRLKLGSYYVPNTEETIYRPQAFQEPVTFEPVTMEELRSHIHLDRDRLSAAYMKSVYDQLLEQGYPEILLQQALADAYREATEVATISVAVQSTRGNEIISIARNATLGELRARFPGQRLIRDTGGNIITGLPDSTPISQIDLRSGRLVPVGLPGSSSAPTGESYRRQALAAAIHRAQDRETAALRELEAATADLQRLLEEARQLGMDSF